MILLVSYGVFFIRTVYRDHQALVNSVTSLSKKNAELTSKLEVRRHSMVTSDPVYGNTYYLLLAFDGYRHAQKGKPCVLMLTEPRDGDPNNPLASIVAGFSNSVSDCFTFGPMDSSSDPDVDRRAKEGMVPNKIVFHAARNDKAAQNLLNALGSLFPMQRSYDLPSPVERTHIYRIPKPGQEDLIWLQFGTNVQWAEQLISRHPN